MSVWQKSLLTLFPFDPRWMNELLLAQEEGEEGEEGGGGGQSD